MASKEDPAVQCWEFVQENLLQFHCENVSWEQASDKIPIKVVAGFPLFHNSKIPGFFKEFDAIFQVYFCIGS